MSKLPKLSSTPPPPPENFTDVESPPPPPRSSYQADPTTVGGPEIWISAILGIVFMLMGKTFASYAITRLQGKAFHTGVEWQTGAKAGTEVAYFELSGFTALTDAGIFLFGLTMLLEAVAMVAIRRAGARGAGVLAAAFVVTVAATVFNLVVVARLFGAGITPLISILAVAFGGYIATYQWQWLKSLKQRPA